MLRVESSELSMLSNNTTVGELPKSRTRDAKAETVREPTPVKAGGLSTPTYLDSLNHLPAYTGSADGDGVNVVGRPRFEGMVFEPPTRGGKWSPADGWGAGMVGGRFVPKTETATAPVTETKAKVVKNSPDTVRATSHPEPTGPLLAPRREHVLLRRSNVQGGPRR